MDGRSFASILLSEPSKVGTYPWRDAILIEWTTDHDDAAKHAENPLSVMIDTFNNTYRSLRIINESLGNLAYSEFVDYRKNWHFENILEYELFDLDKDPYELHNIYPQAPADLKKVLHERISEYYTCQGNSCP
eukprot:m.88129 g.88129  ORF g.88129 m.88129 type:complete len:133 (+) comp13147_c0_seq1:1266-1664(+)